MSSSRKLLHIAALVIASAGIAVAQPLAEGARFPDLTRAGLEGTLPSLSNKVLVVDFWASWCGPCKASFPFLQRLHTTYRNRGVQVIAVSVDTDRKAMQRFLGEHTADFAVVRDADSRLVEAVAPEAMPTSYVIDRQGRVVARHSGFHGEETESALIREVERCLR